MGGIKRIQRFNFSYTDTTKSYLCSPTDMMIGCNSSYSTATTTAKFNPTTGEVTGTLYLKKSNYGNPGEPAVLDASEFRFVWIGDDFNSIPDICNTTAGGRRAYVYLKFDHLVNLDKTIININALKLSESKGVPNLKTSFYTDNVVSGCAGIAKILPGGIILNITMAWYTTQCDVGDFLETVQIEVIEFN